MDHLIIRDFKLSRDFRSILWGKTLWYNLLRSVGAGIVWMVVMLIISSSSQGNSSSMSTGQILALPLVVPLGFFLFMLPLGLICLTLANVIPYVWIISFMCSLFIIPGDPLVWVLSVLAPRAVPAEKPAFINPALIVWLLKSSDTAEVVLSDNQEQKRI